MISLRGISMVGLCVVLMPILSAEPGTIFQFQTEDRKGGPKGTMEVKVVGRNLVMPVRNLEKTGNNGKMIYLGAEGKKGTVIVTDPRHGKYYVMDEATAARIAGQMKQAKAFTNDALKNIPPEALKHMPEKQRKALEEALKQAEGGGAGGGSKTVVKKTGERANKQGLPCELYLVHKDGKLIRRIWATDWSNLKPGAKTADTFKGMNACFEQFTNLVPGGASGPGDEMNFDNGFPVIATEIGPDGKEQDETTFLGSRAGDIDPADFKPEAGLTKAKFGP